MTPANGSALEIEQCMQAALEGDRRSTGRFFELLLKCTVVVPERFQDVPLQHEPEYPNPFMNLLGIADGDRVIIPVFTRSELLKAWAGSELRHKTLAYESLVPLVPPGWWICLNPSADVEKELSPWEIEHLRAGPAAIELLVTELTASDEGGLVTLEELEPTDWPELQESLRRNAPSIAHLRALYVAKEEQEGYDSEPVYHLLVGAELDHEAGGDPEEVRSELRKLCNLATIGSDPARIFVGGPDTESLMLGPFQGLTPLWTRQK